MKKVFFFLSMLFLLVACDKFSDKELSTQQEKWDEVMVVHDEIMPKMGAITETQKHLKLAVIDSSFTELIGKKTAAMNDLKNAEEFMWVWMNDLKQLKPMQETKTHEQIMNYLEEQMVSINKVKMDMENSIKNGRDLLNIINTQNTTTDEE